MQHRRALETPPPLPPPPAPPAAPHSLRMLAVPARCLQAGGINCKRLCAAAGRLGPMLARLLLRFGSRVREAVDVGGPQRRRVRCGSRLHGFPRWRRRGWWCAMGSSSDRHESGSSQRGPAGSDRRLGNAAWICLWGSWAARKGKRWKAASHDRKLKTEA